MSGPDLVLGHSLVPIPILRIAPDNGGAGHVHLSYPLLKTDDFREIATPTN